MITLNSATQSASFAVTSVFVSLIKQTLSEISLEENLVVMAIRRSSKKLRHASLEEIGNHLSEMSLLELRGFGSNVKGIYHELLYAANENSDGDNITVQLFEMTNHPGADVRQFDDENFRTEIQLKAVADTSLINRHLERYPDIPVVATDEVAQGMDGVETSGLTNAQLEADVQSILERLSEFGPLNDAEDVALPVGIGSIAIQASDFLKGKRSLDDASGQVLQDVAVSVATTFLVSLMF
jgi:hypothetical protein